MKKKDAIKWFGEPEEHNYPAALSYLSLIYEKAKAEELVSKLKKSEIVSFKSKDIFRASSLSLLGNNNSHMENNRKKIKDEVPLSPLLLVRDSINGKVIIADGYHRLCAVYAFDEDIEIPCKIV
jgi:disulfide oxidoreductase YuzD